MKHSVALVALLLGASPCNGPCTPNTTPAASAPVAPAAPEVTSEAPETAPPELTIEQLELEQAITSRAVHALAKRVADLGQEWDGVVQEYERAAAAHQAAQRTWREAERLYLQASAQFLEAARVAKRAAEEWRLAQALIVVAAAADAARLDRARAGRDLKLEELSCEQSMSTRAYRLLLDPLGTELVGQDICHIVPVSLGGANHPDNYIPCDASFNRSLGNTWNRGVCLDYGEARCRRAIAVSRRCGTYRGFGI